MEIIKVKGNTYCINTGIMYIPFYKINDEEIIMLDTGWKGRDRACLEEVIKKNNFKVAAILNSHSHRDHIGNNTYLKNKYNCIIAMPAFEAHICSSEANLKLYYSSLSLRDTKENFGYMVCSTDIKIENHQNNITLCGVDFKVIHTVGHSPAQILIVTPDDVAYLGDALVSYEEMETAKLPYSYILTEDLKYKEKLHNLKCEKYVLAHKGVYEDISKLIDDNIDFYKNRAEKVLELIEGAMTTGEILKTVSKSFHIKVDSVNRYTFIERMLKPYVEYLYDIEKLELIMDNGELKYIKKEAMGTFRLTH